MTAGRKRRHLDEITIADVKRAWKYLTSEQVLRKDKDGNIHWNDSEADTGFLKDADALNSLIEPYLLAPSSFVDPPMSAKDIYDRASDVLTQRKSLAQVEDYATSKKSVSSGYRGFSSAPYPYLTIHVDYVDSAATILRLVCNTLEFSVVAQESISHGLEKLMQETALSAVEFLNDSCVVDKNGARWPGIVRRSGREPQTRYTNLFFTYLASLALHKALTNQSIHRWIEESLCKRIDEKLQLVIAWIESQYDEAIKAFWMDEAKGINKPISALYALEMVYRIRGRPEGSLRKKCQEALSTVLYRMSSISEASSLQADFFHVLPNPTGSGDLFYDDRKYIGSFLSLLSLIKMKDSDMVDDDFIRAGELLFRGVASEWIDEPTGIWDDGRPLICYTYDALIGIVSYSLEGAVSTITLRENDVRDAIHRALESSDIGDIILAAIREKYFSTQDLELPRKFSEKKPSGSRSNQKRG